MNRIATSEANKPVVLRIKGLFDFPDHRIGGQIAFALSIQRNKRFDLSTMDKIDNKGYGYPESLLGEINRQSNDGIYHALLNQYYNRRLSEDEFAKLVKLHIDDGFETFNKDIIQNDKGKNAHIDYLLSAIKYGLKLTSAPTPITTSSETENIPAFGGLLNIELGQDSKSEEPFLLRINDENEFDSQHFAVAGMNGSGKTQLIKDVLYQINKASNNELKYIFLDYKGEGKSDKLQSFLKATQAQFIDIQETPFKFNPLTYINLANERSRNLDVKSFRDTIASIDKRIGVKQKQYLEQALDKCFEESMKKGLYPSIQDVYEMLLELYEESNQKPDSLSSIVKELADGIFDADFDPNLKLYNDSFYINLPPTLPDAVRQAAVFLILNYLLSEFIKCNDVQPNAQRIKPIRYIIVIDEAHAYLKNKNMAEVLEKLLRMIRSKGVIIMMLSQGVQEYKQRDFDFTSQVKIPILLNVQHKDIKTAKSFLGTPSSEHPMKEALKKLDKGKGVVNFSEPKLLDINMFWKRGLK